MLRKVTSTSKEKRLPSLSKALLKPQHEMVDSDLHISLLTEIHKSQLVKRLEVRPLPVPQHWRCVSLPQRLHFIPGSTFRTFILPTVRWTERTSILRTRGNDLSGILLTIPQIFDPLTPGREWEARDWVKGCSGGRYGRKVIFLFSGVELALKVPSPCQLVLLMEVGS
jgi:hypothetical protein